jgi:hypothetical protein
MNEMQGDDVKTEMTVTLRANQEQILKHYQSTGLGDLNNISSMLLLSETNPDTFNGGASQPMFQLTQNLIVNSQH